VLRSDTLLSYEEAGGCLLSSCYHAFTSHFPNLVRSTQSSTLMLAFRISTCPLRLSSWKPKWPLRGRSFNGGASVPSCRLVGLVCASKFTSRICWPFSITFTEGPRQVI